MQGLVHELKISGMMTVRKSSTEFKISKQKEINPNQ